MAAIAKSASVALALLGLSPAQEQLPLKPSNHPTPPSIASIPALGFGTWNLDKPNASEAVSVALQTGYRHLDCAAIYGNEKEVGNGIKDGLETTGLDRSSVWITSKLWNDQFVPRLCCPAVYPTLSLTYGIIVATKPIRLSKRSTRR